jgi:hypothetical protein
MVKYRFSFGPTIIFLMKKSENVGEQRKSHGLIVPCFPYEMANLATCDDEQNRGEQKLHNEEDMARETNYIKDKSALLLSRPRPKMSLICVRFPYYSMVSGGNSFHMFPFNKQ